MVARTKPLKLVPKAVLKDPVLVAQECEDWNLKHIYRIKDVIRYLETCCDPDEFVSMTFTDKVPTVVEVNSVGEAVERAVSCERGVRIYFKKKLV